MNNPNLYRGKALKRRLNLGTTTLYVVGATLTLYTLAELVGRAI